MRITTSQLRRIIKEEAQRVLGTRRRAPVRRRRGLFEAPMSPDDDHSGAFEDAEREQEIKDTLQAPVESAFCDSFSAGDEQAIDDLYFTIDQIVNAEKRRYQLGSAAANKFRDRVIGLVQQVAEEHSDCDHDALADFMMDNQPTG